MKFQQVMAFFLTGATVLSMSTTALAADLPDNVDITVSTTQTADEQENNLYTRNDKDLTDAEFEQKYELPENSWFTPAVRYVIENNIMLPAGHIDGKEYFPWFNPAENRYAVANAIYNSAKLIDPELTASYAGMAIILVLTVTIICVLGSLLLKQVDRATEPTPASGPAPESPTAPSRDEQALDRLALTYGLTAREAQTASYVSKGYSLEKTAELLGISINTVRTHMKRVYAKMGIHAKDELLEELEKAS